MFTGYCDVFYYWANKVLLITIQTSPREFTGEKTLWAGGDCIHWHTVSDFLVAQRPFLITSFSQEDLAVITRSIDISPSLMYSYCTQPLYWVNFITYRSFFIMNPQCQVNSIYGRLLENNEKIKNSEWHNSWGYISDKAKSMGKDLFLGSVFPVYYRHTDEDDTWSLNSVLMSLLWHFMYAWSFTDMVTHLYSTLGCCNGSV